MTGAPNAARQGLWKQQGVLSYSMFLIPLKCSAQQIPAQPCYERSSRKCFKSKWTHVRHPRTNDMWLYCRRFAIGWAPHAVVAVISARSIQIRRTLHPYFNQRQSG